MLKKSLIILIFLFSISCKKQKNFDSVEWKSWTESEMHPNTRWQMSNDLVSRYDLKKYTKKGILGLIGEPNSKSNSEYRYFLGVTGDGINTGTLVIHFENDSVIEFEIIQG